MKVKIRADSVEIEGYVNAVERNSRPLMSRIGRFIERICAGAFKRALGRANDVAILLNHKRSRKLGSLSEGNLELEEDSIGLHARATITDPEVIKEARAGNIVGWSFGFHDRAVENGVEEGLPLRKVVDLDLEEVSLITRAMVPCYEGTLVAVRAEDGKEEVHFRGEPMIDEENETTVEDKAKPVEKPVENSDEEKRSTEESTNQQENQEQKAPNVEKPVEKIVKTNYNKAINIINTLKEDN